MPQIGWNAVHIVKDDPLFQYVRDGEYVYYVHSYYGKNCTASTLADQRLFHPGHRRGDGRARCHGTQFQPGKERRRSTVRGASGEEAKLTKCQSLSY